MGQVFIEVPQDVFRSYCLEDSEYSEKLMRDLEGNSIPNVENPAVIPPRRSSLKEDLKSVFGIWKDRPESADEISRRIRDRNNGKDV